MKKFLLLILIFSLFAIKIFSQANPQNIFNHQIDFSTSHQNMWGEGEAFSLELDYTLIGSPTGENGQPIDLYPSFPFGETVETVVAGEWGFEGNFGIGIYLSSVFSIHGFTGGSIDIEYPATITVDYPDHCSFFHGQTVPIQTTLSVRPGWDLTSHFPSGGIIALDFEYGFALDFNFRICVGDCTDLGFNIAYPGDAATGGISPAGVPYDSIPLFYINTVVGDPNYGEVVYPSIDENGFPILVHDDVLPINIPDILGIGLTAEINIPYVVTSDQLEGTCVTAEGSDMWAWFNLDILQFLEFWTQFIPAPYGTTAATVIQILNGTFDLVGYLGESVGMDLSQYVEIDYYILQINLSMQCHLHQRFEFCPTIEATFTFPTALDYTETTGNNNVVTQGNSNIMTIDVGNNLNITYPCYGWDSMQVMSVHYHLVPTFSNHTWNEFRFFLQFDIIHFEITITIDIPELASDTLPSFALPNIEENNIVASKLELSETDYSATMSEDTTNNAAKWSTSFCIPSDCGPLLTYTAPLGSINLDLFPPLWDQSLGEWLIGGWNLTDTTFPGTWLYPKGEIRIEESTHSDVICFGDTTGVLTTTVAYGTCGNNNANCDPYNSNYAPNTAGPWTFNYSWEPTTQNSNTTTDNLNVPAGNYVVTISDVFGCTTSTDYEVLNLFPQITLSLEEDDVLCFGTATGNLYSEVGGGDFPYSWAWSPSGSTVEDPIGVFAGWHSVTVTDNQSCTETGQIFVPQPADIGVQESITNVSCFGLSDGAVSVTVTGGIEPYTYSWSNGVTSSNNPNISAGTYVVTITDDNACSFEYTYTVTQPALLQLSTTFQDVLCFGESTGSINLTVTGGTAPYVYAWSNGETTEDIANLPAGVYTVTVTDDHLCQSTTTRTITEPDAPLQSFIEPTHNICFGGNIGSADLTVDGGVAPYYFEWSNGDITEDIFDLTAGTYTVTITDDNGCTLIDTVTINQPPQIIITSTITHISCFGESDGSVSVVVTDGVPPYTYQWSTGDDGLIIDNLAAGSYILTVTDDIGCTESRTFVVIQPAVLDATGHVTNVLCHGESTGAVLLTVTGGTVPYTYSWSNGATSNNIIDVQAGSYSVSVVDAHGCSLSRNFYITEPPTALSANINSTNVNCFGESNGSINVTPAGAIPPYSFNWSTGSTDQDITGLAVGTYTVTVSDANGCTLERDVTITQPTEYEVTTSVEHVTCFGLTNGAIAISVTGSTPPYSYLWNDGSILGSRNNLPAGLYSITISDSHGCQTSEDFEIEEPGLLQIEVNSTDIYCANQSTGVIDVSVLGGIQPYDFEWSSGETTEDLINITSGNYYLTVTDFNNCQAQTMVTINQPSEPLQASINPTMIRCFGEENGIADLSVTGGTQPYFYEWNTGEIAEDLHNLTPGIYTVTVTDNNYCTITAMTQIIQASTPLVGEISGTGQICNGDSVGTVYIAVSGGVPQYHFDWSNGSWADHLEDVPAGTYTVTVTDAHFCKLEFEYVVTEPDPYLITVFQPDLLCMGMTSEIGLSLISGNNPPYSVEWASGETETAIEINPLETTSYRVTITDVNSCTTTRDITVNVIDSIILEVTTPLDTVCPNTNVPFFVHTEGGGKSDNIVFINGHEYPITIPINLNVQNDTTFVFEVIDTCNFNKQRIEKKIIVEPNPPIVIESDKFEGCAPLSVQFYETSEDYGQSYLWNFDDGDIENLSVMKNPQHTFFSSKTFLVHLRVESDFGCVSEADYPIQVFPTPDASFNVNSTYVDMIDPKVEFYDFSSNGFFYQWDFGDGTGSTTEAPSHTYNQVGEYITILKLTSLQGCVDTASMKITVAYSSLFYAPTAFTPNNDGLNDKFNVFLTNYEEGSFEIIIFDRFGEVVYKSNDVNESWDGSKKDKPFQVGVYAWQVKYKDLHGEEFTKVGNVTLLK